MNKDRQMIWILSLSLSGLLLWAALAPLDIASHALGEVIPEGQLKRIQHLEGGIVQAIFVQEGQKVKQGEPLYELAPTLSDATLAEISGKAAMVHYQIMRLEAQLKEEASMPVNKDSIGFEEQYNAAKAVFEAERLRFLADLQVHRLRIQQKEEELNEIQGKSGGMQSRLELIQKQVKISEKLLKDHLANDFDHLNLLKEKNQVVSELENLSNQKKRTQTALQEAISDLEVLKLKHKESLERDLAEARTEAVTYEERQRKLSDSKERTVIRAPMDGAVLSLFYVTIGGVVPPGGTLLTLVPFTSNLIAACRLNIGDVGFVKPGQKVRLSLMSTSLSGIPPIDGTVIQLSPDALTDQKTGPYYQVRIKPDKDFFGTAQNPYPFKPGLQVMASILVGERTVLQYFLQPLFGDLNLVLTER